MTYDASGQMKSASVTGNTAAAVNVAYDMAGRP
jgi:hypothetical protein